MSSIKTTDSPYPPQEGESFSTSNGNSPMKTTARKRSIHAQKQDFAPDLAQTIIDQYRQLLEGLPVAVYTTNAQGLINLYNQEAVKLWGREPVIGKDMWCGSWKIYSIDGSPMALSTCPMALTLQEGRAVTGHEIVIERPDGTRRNVLPSPKPIFGPNGVLTGAINTLIDITDWKQSEILVRKSEANLRALFDNAKDGFVLFDLKSNILAFNHAAADLYSKVIGKKLLTNKSVSDVLGQELGEYVIAALEKARSGESIERKSKQHGLDGKEYWLRGFYNPVKSTDGSIIGVCMGISDITEEMKANSFASELAAIVQSSDDAIIGKTIEGIVTSWNAGAEKIFGYSSKEMIGESVTKLIPKDRLNEEPQILDRLKKGERVEHFETVRITKKGELRNVSLTISPIRIAEGILIGASKIARDITKQKLLQEKLLASEITFREELEKQVKDKTTQLKEKNEELTQQKNFMETVLDSSIDQICVYDNDFRFIGANKSFSKHSNIKAHEILGKTFLEVFPSYKDSDIHQAIGKTLTTNQSVTIYSKSHSGRHYTIYCVPLTQNNVNSGAIVIAHDNTTIIEANERLEKFNEVLEEKNLTLQKKNEELATQKEFIETVIDSSVDYITVYDMETRVITMNKKTEELMNYKHGETIGKTFLELYPNVENANILNIIHKTLKGEQTHLILPKGNMSHAFDINTIPLKHNDKVYAALVLVHDITEIIDISERLRATNALLEEKNDALQREKDLVETMIDSSVDFIGVYDKETRLISLNKKTLDFLGVKKEDMVGKTFWEINEGKPGTQDQCDDIMKALKGESIHKVYPRSAESFGRDYELFYIPLKHNNEVYAVLAMAHDVTEVMNISEKLRKTNEMLEEKNSALEHSNSELERFAYVASHDLQEPLRKIQMFAGRIREHNKDRMDETSQNYFKKIDASSDRMSILIKDILNYSRLDASEQNFECTDLNEIINHALSDYDLVIEEKKAKIEIEKLPSIDGIPVQLDQLFHNLIGNGLKFSKDDAIPNIQITSRKLSTENILEKKLDKSTAYHEIIIKDNGIGFDQEFSEKIFVIFQRLNERTKYDGTGIGLALCRKIVDNHCGLIFAESKEGKGSEFHIILPEKQKR